MYKAWIRFTTVAALFFLICLAMVLFRNKPVLKDLWQEALLVVSAANLYIAWAYYRRNKDEINAARRKKKE